MKTINRIAIVFALALIAQVNVPSTQAVEDSNMAIESLRPIVNDWPYVGPVLISTGGSGGEDRLTQISTGGSGGEDRLTQLGTGGGAGKVGDR